MLSQRLVIGSCCWTIISVGCLLSGCASSASRGTTAQLPSSSVPSVAGLKWGRSANPANRPQPDRAATPAKPISDRRSSETPSAGDDTADESLADRKAIGSSTAAGSRTGPSAVGTRSGNALVAALDPSSNGIDPETGLDGGNHVDRLGQPESDSDSDSSVHTDSVDSQAEGEWISRRSAYTTVAAVESPNEAGEATADSTAESDLGNESNPTSTAEPDTSTSPEPAVVDPTMPDRAKKPDPTHDESGRLISPLRRGARLSGNSTLGRELPPVAQSVAEPLPLSTVDPLTLGDVIETIYGSYPLLQSAVFGRNIASGEQLAAEGAFDLKFKASTENAPLGFYQTHRHGMGLEQNLYSGGQVFGGYKLGRGNFEPWYGERETNDGGEFRVGAMVPLGQNRAIDERRAELWKATYGRQAVEPNIQLQVIEFVRAGSYAYWDWVAAGLNYRYSLELYELTMDRDQQLRDRVNQGVEKASVVFDNQRLIASRRVKLIDAERKLQQAAIKLSLFYRTEDGLPYVPSSAELPENFPVALPWDTERLQSDIALALEQRPELRELDFFRRIVEIDLAYAHNMTQPEIDAIVWSAQDVGGPSSSKKDKTPFQSEASLQVSVPLQRRKAQGKIWATEGKIAQINVKRRFTSDKVGAEVQYATVAVIAAYNSLEQARESVRYAEEMERFERINLEEGVGDLLPLTLREVATFEARLTEVDALLRYFEAQADYRAAMAADVPQIVDMGPPPAGAIGPNGFGPGAAEIPPAPMVAPGVPEAPAVPAP
jgi:outer membrane protein TolC